MRKQYFLLWLLSAIFTITSYAQTPIITNVVDACGNNGKFVEIYASGTVDFSDYKLVRRSNAGTWEDNGVDIDLSTFGERTDEFIYLIRDLATMNAEFPSAGVSDGNSVVDGGISHNGDDSYRLVQITGDVVIDQFGGDIDGTGEPWEYEDSWGSRNNGEGPNPVFTIEEWTFNAVNVLDDFGLCNSATPLEDTVDTVGSYEVATTSGPTTSAPVPTEDEANVVSLYSDAYTDVAVANYDPNWGQPGHTLVNTTFDPTGEGTDFVLAYPNFTYQGTEIGNNLDLSDMDFLHVDIWVAEGTDRMVKVSPINNGTGAGEILVEVPVTPGSWNSVTLAKADFTGMTWDSVFQLKFDGQFNADGTANTTPFDIYVDNIYFSQEPTTSEPLTLSATYTDGDISVAGVDGYDPDCAELLNIQLPDDGNDWLITSVDVQYDITAQGGAYMSEQRSQLHFVNSNTTESDVSSGAGFEGGVFSYDREGLIFANGIFTGGTELQFELRAWRTWPTGNNECSTEYQQINNNTWTVTVTYEEAPDCQFASGLVVDDITDTTVDISWTASPSEDGGYEYVLMNGGEAADVDTALQTGNVPSGQTNVALADLVTITDYSFYLRTICSDGVLSDWTPVLDFVTECGPFGNFENDFTDEETGGLPECWTGNTTSTGTSPNLEVTTIGSPQFGDKQVRMQSSGDAATVHYLISPELNNLADVDKRLRISARQLSSTGANVLEVGVMSDPTDLSTFTVLQTINFDGNVLEDYDTIIPTGTPENYFAFRATFSATFQTIYLDRVIYEDSPSCLEPFDLVIDDVTGESVDFSWSDVEEDNNYNWSVFELGDDPETDEAVASGSASETNATATGLAAGTFYFVRVQADCGEGDLSVFIDEEFFTGPCVPTTTNTSDYISAFSTNGATQNINISKSGILGNGFANFYDTENIISFASGSLTFSNTFVGGTNGLRIWVDWNNDLEFSDDEVLFFENSTSLTKTGTITVPSDIALGDYRMRIRAQWGSAADPGPCENISFGEAIDIKITVGEAPSCLAPLNLIADSIDVDGLELSWDAVDSAVDYTWYVFADGDNPEVDEPVATGTTSETNALVENLDSATAYQAYVQSNCGDENSSDLSVVASFSTLPDFCAGDLFYDSGGPDGNYQNNENVTTTIFPSTDGDVVSVTFNSFNTEQNYDGLMIYDGPDATSPLISSGFENPGFGPLTAGTWTGDPTQPFTAEGQTFVSTHTSGALTFVFTSDGSATRLGWEASVTCAPAPEPEFANVQVIHNSPDPAAASVDVYLNGALLPELTGVSFREASAFLEAPANVDIAVDIVPAGADISESVFNQTFNLEADENYIIVANGVLNTADFETDNAFELSVYAGAKTAADDATGVDVLVHHGSPDAPAVDVNEPDAGNLVSNIAYPEFDGYLALPVADYVLEIAAAGNPDALVAYQAPLATLGGFEGAAITVVASGFFGNDAGDDNFFGLWVATAAGGPLVELPLVETEPQSTSVQVIHNSPDPAAATVDVYLNGVPSLLMGVDFRTASPFVPAPAGEDFTIDVVPVGGDISESVFTATLNLEADLNYIIVANGVLNPADFETENAFELSVYAGARTEAESGTGVDILVHHGSPDAPAVDVNEVSAGNLVSNIAYPEFDGYLELPVADYVLEIAAAGNTEALAAYQAPLATLGGFEGTAITIVASGFFGDDAGEDNGFGLWVATAAGGPLLELPLVTTATIDFDSTNFSYYPNPVSNELRIDARNVVEQVEVFNMLGQRVISQRPNQTNPTLNMSNFEAGVYLMKVSINGSDKTFQIIKN